MDTAALVNVVAALGATIVLVLGCGWIARRMTAAGRGGVGQIRVVASLPVGSREKLLVVGIGDQQKLIGVTSQHICDLGIVDLGSSSTVAGGEGGEGAIDAARPAFKHALERVLGARP